MLGSGRDGVIPLCMEVVARYGEGAHFGVFDLDAFFIVVGVEFAGDLESCGRGGGGDQVDHGETAGERAGAPVLRDLAEHAVLDLVPFRGAGRIMANRQRETGLVGELLQFCAPQARARRVGATAICGDQ